MNKFVRAIFYMPVGITKMIMIKISHAKSFRGPFFSMISPLSEITLDYGGKLSIGKRFKMRDWAKVRVRKGSECIIGNNTSLNSNCMIICHERIVIGDNVQLSPNVQIYDHDHDFRAGLIKQKYKTTPVIIGNNVWIGANTVILRGTEIGDYCVIGAGSVLKGKYSAGSLVIQKRETEILDIMEKKSLCEIKQYMKAVQP